MIIECKQCHSKFKLSNDEYTAIGTEGRMLKCGNCYHMWLVKPNNLLAQISEKPDNILLENLQNNHRAAITLLNILPNETNFEKLLIHP